MPRFYIFTVFFSVMAGLLVALLAPLGEYKLLVKLLLLIFMLTLLNEKTALFENLVSRRARSKLRNLGFLILLMILLLMVLGVL